MIRGLRCQVAVRPSRCAVFYIDAFRVCGEWFEDTLRRRPLCSPAGGGWLGTHR